MQHSFAAWRNQACAQNHIYFWGDAHYSQILGPERANRIDACNTARRCGLHSRYIPIILLQYLELMTHDAISSCSDGLLIQRSNYPPYAYQPGGKAQLLVPLSPAQVESGNRRMHWEIPYAACCMIRSRQLEYVSHLSPDTGHASHACQKRVAFLFVGWNLIQIEKRSLSRTAGYCSSPVSPLASRACLTRSPASRCPPLPRDQ